MASVESGDNFVNIPASIATNIPSSALSSPRSPSSSASSSYTSSSTRKTTFEDIQVEVAGEEDEGHGEKSGSKEEALEKGKKGEKGEDLSLTNLVKERFQDEITLQIRTLETLGFVGILGELCTHKYELDGFPENSLPEDEKAATEKQISDLSRDSIAETMQNVESTSPLHLACAKNEYELVEALLQSNANVNTCDVQRNTPLHVAAMFGHIETVKLLLSNGADGTLCNASGNNALYYLSSIANSIFQENPTELISLCFDLVEAGCDINTQSFRGRSPFHELCFQGNNSLCVSFLHFMRYVDANSMDMRGETSLHIAVRTNNIQLVDILLDNGAMPDMSGLDGSCRELASRMGFSDILKLIDSHMNASCKDGKGGGGSGGGNQNSNAANGAGGAAVGASGLKKNAIDLSMVHSKQDIAKLEKRQSALLKKLKTKDQQYYDTYGFALQSNCAPLHRSVRQKIHKAHVSQFDAWRLFFESKGIKVDKDKKKLVQGLLEMSEKAEKSLRKLVHGGVPFEYRATVWYVFSGGAARAARSSVKYASLKNKYSKKHREQIELDLHRTFPNHNFFSCFDGLNALARVLNAYALYNRGTGYCQGMNFIAGFLLLVMPEEYAFWTLSAIVEDSLKDYFCESMLGLLIDNTILEQLLLERAPRLACHLKDICFPLNYLSSKWFLCMYLNALPTETVLRIWDRTIFDGPKVLIEVAVAIALMHEQVLLAEGDMMSVLEIFGDIGSRIYDCESLMKEHRRVSNSRLFQEPLADLRARYFNDAVQTRHASFTVTVSGELDEPLSDGFVVCRKKRKRAMPIANKIAGADMAAFGELDAGDSMSRLLKDMLLSSAANRDKKAKPPRPPRTDLGEAEEPQASP